MNTGRQRSFTVAGAPTGISAEEPATIARPDARPDARTDARTDARPTLVPSQAGTSLDRRERKRHIRDVTVAAASLRAALDRVAERTTDLLTEMDRAAGTLGHDEVTGILALNGLTRDMVTPRDDM